MSETALERLAQAILDGRVRIKVEHTRQNSCGDVFVTGRETHTIHVDAPTRPSQDAAGGCTSEGSRR